VLSQFGLRKEREGRDERQKLVKGIKKNVAEGGNGKDRGQRKERNRNHEYIKRRKC